MWWFQRKDRPTGGRGSGDRGSGDALEAMRRLEGVVASAMDGIITIDTSQTVTLFNPAAERMFGLPASEAIGQPIARFLPERFRYAHGLHISRFIDTGVTDRRMGSLSPISGLRADGREFPIEASISQIRVGGDHLATVILRDITERKAAEDALLDSRRRLEGIVESAMDALITVDENQRIIVFNPAAERMFGVSAARAIGAPLERFIPERFRPGHAAHIRRFRETGVTNRRMGALGAISGLRANGEEFPVEAAISQIDIGGAPILTVILRDITARRATEEARLLLAREVDHRAKNALAVVQAVVSLSRAPTKDAFVEAVRGRVAALGRAHTLLADSGWQGADFAQVIADETEAFGQPGQIVWTGPPVSLAPNAVQPVSLLIHELATNAVKHGALSAEGGRVDIALDILPDRSLRLRWTERGGPPVGPPQSKGFGSTLVDQVATRQLGGRLDLRWLPAGLELSAIWPAEIHHARGVAGASESHAETAPTGSPTRGGRVLIVEDEALLAMEMVQAFGDLGWTIVGPASTVDEALRLIADTPAIDAAILDVNLGGQLVYPVAERLEALQVPFLFCTGYQQLPHDDRFAHCPIIRKPVNTNLLTSELQRLGRAAA